MKQDTTRALQQSPFLTFIQETDNT